MKRSRYVRQGQCQALRSSGGYVLLVSIVILLAVFVIGTSILTTTRSSKISSINARKRVKTRYVAESAAAAVVNMAANQATRGAFPDSTFSFQLMDQDVEVQMKMSRKGGKLDVVQSRGLFDMLAFIYYGFFKTEAKGPAGAKITISQRVRFEEYPVFQFERLQEGSFLNIFGGGPTHEFKGRIHFNNSYYEVSRREIDYWDWATSACEIYYARNNSSTPAPSFTCRLGDTLMERLAAPSSSSYLPLKDIYWPSSPIPAKVASGDDVPALNIPVGGLAPIIIIQKKDHNEYGSYDPGFDNDPLRLHKMIYKADLILRKNWSGATASYHWRENKADGSDKPATDSAALLGAIVDLDSLLTGAAIPGDAFYDYFVREWMSVTYVDMRKLCDSLDAYYPSAEGSIVFLEGTWDTTASLTLEGAKDTSTGIRDLYILINGDSLTRPLTIASNAPVYVWGDFNTAAPIRNAAIIADFHMLLSNAWDINYRDSYCGMASTSRDASSTSGNYCYMSGVTRDFVNPARNDPYHDEYYLWHEEIGGNLMTHDFMLVEDWQNPGATRYWRGSKVHMWRSNSIDNEEYTYGTFTSMPDGTYRGRWTVYMRPDRDLGFDTRFNQMSNMPPGVPRVASPLVVDYYEVR